MEAECYHVGSEFQTTGAATWKLELGIIDSNRFDGRINSNRFGMANRKPTGFDSAVVTSSGRFNRGHGTKPCSRLFSVSFCGSVFAQVY